MHIAETVDIIRIFLFVLILFVSLVLQVIKVFGIVAGTDDFQEQHLVRLSSFKNVLDVFFDRGIFPRVRFH